MPDNAKIIFWLVGESSGDVHAAQVLARLNESNSAFKHMGAGGPLMAAQGFACRWDWSRFAVIGFWEVLQHLAFFKKVMAEIEQIFKKDPPALVVLVDYPGMNMRVAKLAKKYNIPVLYYIVPQFWAWKFHRVHALARYTNLALCILPFEEKLLQDNGVKAAYAGHPILEELPPTPVRADFAQEFGLTVAKPWVAFFPGSRPMEVKKHLRLFLQTIDAMDVDAEFLISHHPQLPAEVFPSHTPGGKTYRTIKGNNHRLLALADACAVKSGTTSLEAAVLGTPAVIVYQTSAISYLLARYFINIRRIGLPNIILDEMENVLPELIQHDARPTKIAACLHRLLHDEPYKTGLQQKLEKLHRLLGAKPASVTVAAAIEDLCR